MTHALPPAPRRAVLAATPSLCPHGFASCAPAMVPAKAGPAAGAVLGVAPVGLAGSRRRGATAADARGPGV